MKSRLTIKTLQPKNCSDLTTESSVCFLGGLLEIIAQKLVQKSNHIQTILNDRLEYFKKQGLNASFSYQARTASLSELAVYDANFNRIIFNVLSFLLESHQSHLEINVRNNAKNLTIEFNFPHGPSERSLLPLKNGFSLLSPRKKPHMSLLAVQRLVRESGGSFSLKAFSSSRNPSYCLQIPLSPTPNHNKSSPPPKEISTHRFEYKGALTEGVFLFDERRSA